MSQTTERPRDDDQRQRERRQPSQADKAAMDKMAAEQKEAAGAASIGAQIILDYNEDGSKGARGGAGTTIAENTQARDAHLVSVGLDPVAPSGPPLGSAEALRKKQEAMAAPRYLPPTSSTATRMSSLAAGVSGENLPEQPPPEGGNGEGEGEATAPVNRDVPLVTQSGTTLNCTMGNWDGEPTSYSYAWQIDGAAAGSDAANYEVQAGDVGKSATCTVTATNAAGSTAAPPSNSVTIA
jgi:hypothetical protein